LGSIKRCFELVGRDVVAVAVVMRSALNQVHPRQRREFDFVDVVPRALFGPVDQLGLVVAVDRLSEGVDVRLSGQSSLPVKGRVRLGLGSAGSAAAESLFLLADSVFEGFEPGA